MRTSLRGILPIDEAIEVFAYLARMGEDDLDIFLFEVNDRVEGLLCNILFEKIS